MALILIFATPIKNVVIHGNPFYPVRIEIVGKVLNHALPLYNDAPGYLANAPKAKRWLYSVAEIKRAYWNHDQYSANPDRNRMGGFFNVYVLFQVLLLLYLIAAYRNRATQTAAIVIAVTSLIAANFPQSHELRYFMYWMIVLISSNLYLITKYSGRIFNPRRYTLVALIALIIVGIKTEFAYLKPSFNTLNKFKEKKTSSELLTQIKPGDKICLPRNYPFSFIYTPWFHPELNFDYRIRSGFLDSCDSAEKVF